ncbi:FAD-dependent oxidoreductase [Candidatus Parcubacteria bacterium]|nr:MAG: FAD-dependent oxidoreductase [Candidatus Parcubacteria bacterium]
MHDLIIIGGGPAGAAAAVYAARKRLKSIMIVEEWGGQSVVSTDIQNWIGTPVISGPDLAKSFKTHVEQYAGEYLEIKRTRATSLHAFDDRVEVELKDGSRVSACAALVTTGANRRKLEVPGAAEFDNKGLTYCASCDGPLFADRDVAVIGGGNAAFETALQLLAYCKSVTLLNRTDAFKADEITTCAALADPKMKAHLNAETLEVLGDAFVTGLRWKDVKTGEEHKLDVDGIFVEIGLIPNTAWLNSSIEKNKIGQVIVDPRTKRTSHQRVWAAGDCTDALYHQNNIAAGDAVVALEDIYIFLRRGGNEA